MSSQTITATVPFTLDNVVPGMLAFPDSPDIYRIRIQSEDAAGGPTIKHLVAPNTSKTLTGLEAHHRRGQNLTFNRVPAGDWIVARLAVANKDAKLEIVSKEPDTAEALRRLGLGSVEPLWCHTTVDMADCGVPSTPTWTTAINPADGTKINVPAPSDLQCMDYVSASVIPTPAALATTITEKELLASRDPGLAPRFLAHVTENGSGSRVVSFLLERIPDVRIVREAGPGDLEACRRALARLHALGVARRQLARHSFLVRKDGSVLIWGPFDGSPCECNEGELQAEMESLEAVLAQSPSVFEDQAARILRPADPQRNNILDEFEKAHGVVVPFVYWLESAEGGGRITLILEQHGVLAKEFEENGFHWTKELQKGAEKRFGPSATEVV